MQRETNLWGIIVYTPTYDTQIMMSLGIQVKLGPYLAPNTNKYQVEIFKCLKSKVTEQKFKNKKKNTENNCVNYNGGTYLSSQHSGRLRQENHKFKASLGNLVS